MLPGGSREVEMNRIQQLKNKIQKLSTKEISNIFLTIGLSLLVLGRFLDPNSIAIIVFNLLGSSIFFIGMAIFVAIARNVLDY
jgi:hypothetical protein